MFVGKQLARVRTYGGEFVKTKQCSAEAEQRRTSREPFQKRYVVHEPRGNQISQEKEFNVRTAANKQELVWKGS